MPDEENEFKKTKSVEPVKEDFGYLIIMIATAENWEKFGNISFALGAINHAEFLAKKFENEGKIKECQEIKERLLKKQSGG